MDPLVRASGRWRKTWHGASVGILVMRGAANPVRHAELDRLGAEVEARLRDRYAAGGREAILAEPG